jgi:hypothetical protein
VGGTTLHSNLVKGPAIASERRRTASHGLPTPNNEIDIVTIDLDKAGSACDPFGRDQRRAAASKGVKDDVAASGAVFERINQT